MEATHGRTPSAAGSPRGSRRLAKTEKMSFRMGDPFGNLAREAQLFEGFLMALDEELKQHPDSVLSPTEPAPLGSDQASEARSGKKGRRSSSYTATMNSIF